MKAGKTVVAIHQPNFLPWIGFFHKMFKADVFIYLDDVSFSKNSFQNRNRIKTSRGIQWLTVPVLHKGFFKQNTNQVRINETVPWRRKHLSTLQQAYGKKTYFKNYWNDIDSIYRNSSNLLIDLNVKLIEFIKSILNINTKVLFSSDLDVHEKDPTMRLAELVKKVGGEIYLSGIGGQKYLNIDVFPANGIELKFQKMDMKAIDTLNDEFYMELSIIDALFKFGAEVADIIRRL